MPFGRRGVPAAPQRRRANVHSTNMLAYALMQPDAVLGPWGRMRAFVIVCVFTVWRALTRR